MSKALDNADALRTRLLTDPLAGELTTGISLPGLADSILVDRQKNINSDIAKAVAKAQGTAIVILWNGYRVLDKNASRPKLGHSYTISVFSKPVLAGGLTADDVMQAVITRLWRWVADPRLGVSGEAEVTGGGLIPNDKFLIYDVGVTIPTLH